MGKGETKGVVYVEFLIVFWPMMLLWLGLAHMGLLYSAHLMVHHGAARAARAAVVILPDEEGEYDDDPPFSIVSEDSDTEGLEAYEDAKKGGRLHTIRNAPRITLAAVSPGLPKTIGLGAIGDVLAGYAWTKYGVAVTFPDGSGGYLTRFDKTGSLVTRVTYLYRCPVPVFDRLVCHSYFGSNIFGANQKWVEKIGDWLGMNLIFDSGIGKEQRKILNTVQGHYLGLAGMGADVSSKLGLETGLSWRFLALEAERTLPMQGQHK
jgi:hypothetical protein